MRTSRCCRYGVTCHKKPLAFFGRTLLASKNAHKITTNTKYELDETPLIRISNEEIDDEPIEEEQQDHVVQGRAAP